MTKKQRRFALLGGVFAVAAFAVALVLNALGGAVAYFYTPSDLAALASPPAGVFRLGGLVEPGSVRHGEDEAEVRFAIVDEAGRSLVRYRGILPDLFREGQGVVVQGRMSGNGEVEAIEVLAKHDETYMPRELADALKEQGRWRDAGDAPEKY